MLSQVPEGGFPIWIAPAPRTSHAPTALHWRWMRGPRCDTRQTLALLALLCAPAESPQSRAAAQGGAPLPAKGALSYNVAWRLIDAGKARLRWTAGIQPAHPG